MKATTSEWIYLTGTIYRRPGLPELDLESMKIDDNRPDTQCTEILRLTRKKHFRKLWACSHMEITRVGIYATFSF